MLLLLAGFAFARPLEVVVLPDPPAPAVERPRPGPQPPVPLNPGRVQVDGVPDDEAWGSLREAPPLAPTLTGAAPPEVHLFVARAPDALAAWVDPLPPGTTATLSFDPDGTQQRWWRVVLSEDGAAWSRCGWESVPSPVPWPSAPRSAPCEPIDGEDARSARGWELRWRYEALPPATTAARLLWTVDGPDAHDGTWAPFGRGGDEPRLGRRLGIPPRAPTIETLVDPFRRAWRARLVPDENVPWGDWAWTLWREGVPLATGTVAMRGDPVLVGGPWDDLPDAVLGLRFVDGDPLAPGAFAGLAGGGTVRLLTPVWTDAIALGWDLPASIDGVLVEVLREDGRPLGQATVDLPAGTGRMLLVGGWSGTVRVRVAPLLDATAVRVRQATRPAGSGTLILACIGDPACSSSSPSPNPSSPRRPRPSSCPSSASATPTRTPACSRSATRAGSP